MDRAQSIRAWVLEERRGPQGRDRGFGDGWALMKPIICEQAEPAWGKAMKIF